MVGLCLLDHDLEALDVLFVAVDGEADADVLLLGEIAAVVGLLDAAEALLDLLELVGQQDLLLQREAVDGAQLILDVGGVARLAGRLLEALRDAVDDVVGAFAAVDHVEDLHFHLLLAAVRLRDERVEPLGSLRGLVRFRFFVHGMLLSERGLFVMGRRGLCRGARLPRAVAPLRQRGGAGYAGGRRSSAARLASKRSTAKASR